MTEQPTALRLADSQDCVTDDNCGYCMPCSVAAELRRLHQQELANIEWQEKTAWVQKTAKPDELGMHRADVMSRRLGRLKNQRDALLEKINGVLAAERSEGRGRGGFINTPPTREHQRRVAQAWQELHAAIKAVEGETK